MQNEIDVTETITMKSKLDDYGQRSYRAAIDIAATGKMMVNNRSFAWDGLTDADAAARLRLYARWAFGRQLEQAVLSEPSAIEAIETKDGWTTAVTWPKKQGSLGVIVTVDGFSDFRAAVANARDVVNKQAQTLVPATDATERSTLFQMPIKNLPDWLHTLRNDP